MRVWVAHMYCHKWNMSCNTCVTAGGGRLDVQCSLGLLHPSFKSSVATATCRLLLSVISAIDRPIRGQQALCQVSAGLLANLPTSRPKPPTAILLSLQFLCPSPTSQQYSVCHPSSWQIHVSAKQLLPPLTTGHTECETKSFDTLKVNNPQHDTGTLTSFGPPESFSPKQHPPSPRKLPQGKNKSFLNFLFSATFGHLAHCRYISKNPILIKKK